MGELRETFFLAHYHQMREEIAGRVQQRETNERFGLTATAILWAWLATNEKAVRFEAVYFIPALISALLALKAHAIHCGLQRLTTFLRAQAATHQVEDVEWENYLEKNRGKLWRRYEVALWIFLTGFNLAAAIIIVWK